VALPFTVQSVFPVTAVLFFIRTFCFALFSDSFSLYPNALEKSNLGLYNPNSCTRISSSRETISCFFNVIVSSKEDI